MAQIGKAWIEVRADLVKFPAELKTKLTAAIKAGMDGVSFDALGDKAAEAGRAAADRAGEQFEARSKVRSRRAGEEAGRGMLAGITSVFKGGGRDSGGGLFSGLLSGAKDAFSGGLSGIVGQLGQIGQLSGQLGNLGGVAGGVIQMAAFAALIPIIIGLAGALVQLSGALLALPAAAGVGLAVIAPLIVAFQGFGEAVSAGLSGDVEAFNQALKGLAPNARQVAREFVGLGPLLKGIKRDVQNAFFGPLVGQMAQLAPLLNVVRGGMTLVAGALGRVAAGFVELLGSNDIVEVIGDVFESAGRIVDRVGPSIINLVGVLFGITEKGLPFVERFFDAFANGLDQLTGWLSQIQQDGRLTAFLENATETGQALWGVLKGIGEYIFTLLASFGDEGTTMLQGLNKEIQELIAWLGTAEGAKFMENLGVAISAVGAILIWFIGIVPYLLNFFSELITGIRGVDDVLGAIGAGFVSLIGAIWSFLKSAGKAIASFFTDDIPRWFGQLVDWFSELPGRLTDGASNLGQTLVDWLTNAFLALVEAAWRGVGWLIAIILILPGMILSGLIAMPGMLADLFSAAWDWVARVTMEKWDAIVAFASSLPGRLAAAGEAVIAWGMNLWNTVSNFAVDTVTSGFNKVVAFFAALPGRIAAFGPALWNAAVGLGRRIGEGLSNIGDFASDIGKKIVNAVKIGINFVIDGMNRGIADIDDFIPGTLPRIPRFARGGIVDSPTVGLVGEAGREVILPLTDPKRTQELAEDSGLLSMLRGAGAATVVNVVAYLDPSGVLIPITRTVVGNVLDEQGGELAYAR